MPFVPPNLDSTLGVLSVMITPAVLILATGSLILTTTNRLVRVVDRVRLMLPEFEKQAEIVKTDPASEQKRAMMYEQLDTYTVRTRIVQRALTRLYMALGFFLATSASLGVISLVHVEWAWIALALCIIGVGLLLSSSVLLIYESRLSLRATYAELDYIRQISQHHAPPGIRERRWRLFG